LEKILWVLDLTEADLNRTFVFLFTSDSVQSHREGLNITLSLLTNNCQCLLIPIFQVLWAGVSVFYDQQSSLLREAIQRKLKLNIFPSTFGEDNTSVLLGKYDNCTNISQNCKNLRPQKILLLLEQKAHVNLAFHCCDIWKTRFFNFLDISYGRGKNIR
jgi:hypothetical protein